MRSLGWRSPVFRLMRETGLRVGDAVKVRGEDFSRAANGEPQVTIIAEKTGKLLVAPVSESLYHDLSGRVGYCFKNGLGGHISRQTVWRWLKTACRACRIEPDGVSPHSLRKCFAVEVMRREGLEAVQNALQHSNAAVTRVYAYSDTVGRYDSDEPIRWRDIDLICEYILDRMSEGGYNGDNLTKETSRVK